MEKVRVGILGCANIAKKYVIKAFQSIDNADVVSIASRDLDKAKKWAREFGITTGETYDDLISDKDVDAVYVPLPIGLHKEWIIKAAQAGKHVISEKSLAGELKSVKEIIETCKKENRVLCENFMCDYHPQHQKVLDLIGEGKLGTPFVFRGYFGFPLMPADNFRYNKELGGGSLNDAGAYTIFMARKMMAAEPIAVSAILNHDKNYGVDMSGSALLEFPGGKSALVAFNFDALYQNNYSIWGSKGLVNVKRAYGIPPDMKPEIELITNENMKETIIQIDVPAANHFNFIFRDFCETVLGGDKKKREGMYESILNQAKVLEAVRVSVKENKRVRLAEL